MKAPLPSVLRYQWLFSSPSSMLLEVQVVQEMAEYPDQHRHDYFLFSAPNGQSLIQGNVHKEISEPLLKYIYSHDICSKSSWISAFLFFFCYVATFQSKYCHTNEVMWYHHQRQYSSLGQRVSTALKF